MKISDVPSGSALLVSVDALSIVKTGDNVLLAINGVIDKDGVFIPFSERLQLCKEQLNKSMGDDVVFLKQNKNGL